MSTIYEDVATLQEQVALLQAGINFAIGQSTTTYEKFNGKTVYCKTVDVGALPNATHKLVATGLNMANVEILKIEGVAKNSGGTTVPLPNTTPSTTYLIGCFITAGGNIQIDTAIDRSDYTGIVKIFYINND